jgi:hypothetical protein
MEFFGFLAILPIEEFWVAVLGLFLKRRLKIKKYGIFKS